MVTLDGKAEVLPKLTKRIVDDAALRDKPYFVWCSDLAGFGVRVFPSGKKVYYCDYRAEGVRRRMNIGAHGKITTEEARKLAIVTMGSVVKGDDPLLERKTRRRSMTVAQLCDQYLELANKGLILGKGGRAKKASTLATDHGRVERHIKPLLGRKLVVDLKQADIARFIRDVTAGKTAVVEKSDKKRGKAIVEGGAGTASRTAGLLGGILTHAVSEGIIEFNPARGVKRPADNKKERRLAPAEYRALRKALDAAEAESWQAIAGIKLLVLTGCRISEIVKLRWEEVDIEGSALRLEDSKTRKSIRPLGKAAIAILEALSRAEDEHGRPVPWVLPGIRDVRTPFGSLSNAIERITAAAKLEGVTAHVLRHSFSSVGGDLDISEATIGAIIGHAGYSITSRYVHRLDSVLVATADKIAAEVERQMSSG